MLSELADGEFVGVAEVDGAGEFGGRCHEADEALDEIIHVAKGTGLGAVAINRDGLAAEGLHDEVRNHPAILRVHAGAVGVEDAGDFDF